MNNIFVNTLIQKILFNEKWWFYRHLLFWLFIYLDEFCAFVGILPAYDEYYSILFSLLLDLIVVYINLYLLFPKVLKRKKLAEYLGFTVLSVIGLILVEQLIEIYYWSTEEIPLEFYINVFVQTTVTLGAAVSIKVLKEALLENQKREEAEKERLSFELKNLKKQINPHFLFNILNGIYIQSQTEHEAVPKTIMQFSDLLRYQIYDAEKSDKVLLTKEVEFLENYIALEQIRRDHTKVIFNTTIEDKSFRIEPLLFLALVENAFKYSIASSVDQSRINMDLKQENGILLFHIENTIGAISMNGKEEASGFGLRNLRKRLNLLYPDSYVLKIDESKKGIFSVQLKITVYEMHNNR